MQKKIPGEDPCWSAILISCMQFYWNRSSAWVLFLNLLHIFTTSFPKNTWRAASVSCEINFEKWEEMSLNHDENITIAYFFAVQ